MKPSYYALIRRSKVDADQFAIEYEGAVLRTFSLRELFNALTNKDAECRAIMTNIEILWSNGQRTIERLEVTCTSTFASFDVLNWSYKMCLLLRAQGLPEAFEVPVDIHTLHDSSSMFIKEIRFPQEDLQDLLLKLAMYSKIDLEDDEDEDFDEDDEDADEDFWLEPKFQRQQVGDWGYRVPEWLVTLTDEQVAAVQRKEVGIDNDIFDLPKADDATDVFF